MIELYEKILGENFTVQQTESEVRNYLYQVKALENISTKKLKKKINKEN